MTTSLGSLFHFLGEEPFLDIQPKPALMQLQSFSQVCHCHQGEKISTCPSAFSCEEADRKLYFSSVKYVQNIVHSMTVLGKSLDLVSLSLKRHIYAGICMLTSATIVIFKQLLPDSTVKEQGI